MKKAIFILFFAFMLLILGRSVKAEHLFQMGNGFEIRLSDEWEQRTNLLTNGSRQLLYAVSDLSSLGIDLDSVDATSFVKNLTESMGIKTEHYRSYDPLNGFHTTVMDMELANGGMTISSPGAVLIKSPYVCLIFCCSADPADRITEDDIIDIVYCISFNGSNDSVMDHSPNSRTENGLLLYKTPLLIRLNEDEYNLAYLGMPEDSVTLNRVSYSYDQIKEFLTLGESTDCVIWRIGTDGFINYQAPCVKIRIKENKVPETLDIRNMNQEQQKLIWDELVSSFRSDGKYMTEAINGIPYACFSFPMGFQQRYMTILNGDLIYVFVESPDELTEDDLNLLHTVLESITVPESQSAPMQKVDVTVDDLQYTFSIPETYYIYTSALGKTGIYGDLDTGKLDAYLQQLGSCIYGEHTKLNHQFWISINDRSPGLGSNPSKEMIEAYYNGQTISRGPYTKESFEGQDYYLFADGQSINPNGINYRISTFKGCHEISVRWESGSGTRTEEDITELKNIIRSVVIGNVCK